MKQYKKAVGLAWIVSLCLFNTTITACSSEADEPEDTEQNNDGRKLRQLTITDVPITRATLTDNTNTLGASWKAEDEATILNVSAIPSVLLYGYFSAVSNATTSAFKGSVSCATGDEIALIYPKVAPQVGYGSYAINLTGQKGTLSDIATNFHYIYGVGTVTGTTTTTATATIESMKSLLAVCKFTFKDQSNNNIPVKILTIGYGNDKYPLIGTVTPSTDPTSVVATPDTPDTWETPLDITLDSETSDGVYVALFPTSNERFHFTVTGSTGTYTGTATATLNAGKFYPVTLTLTQ